MEIETNLCRTVGNYINENNKKEGKINVFNGMAVLASNSDCDLMGGI
jgi:hypothetical protein